MGGRVDCAAGECSSVASSQHYESGWSHTVSGPGPLPVGRAGHCLVLLRTQPDFSRRYLVVGGTTADPAPARYSVCSGPLCVDWSWAAAALPDLQGLTSPSCAVFSQAGREVVLVIGNTKTLTITPHCTDSANCTLTSHTSAAPPVEIGKQTGKVYLT